MGNVYAQDPIESRIGIVELTANEGAGDALGEVKCQTRLDVANILAINSNLRRLAT